MIVDTHCHLDDKRYDDDLEEVIARAKAEGVGRFIIPGADPDTLEKAVEICEMHEDIYFSAGVHPYDIDKYDRSYLEGFLSHPKCVAIGECGLDYYRLPDDPAQKEEVIKRQKEVFIDQIALAKSHHLPLIVHIREATPHSLELLKRYAGKEGGVLHCFNADESLLVLSKQNFYYGIGGVLTFKNARKLPQVLPKIPFDRIVLETDAPYLTPHPYRGKRNEPSYTALVCKKASEVLGVSYETLKAQTTQNAYRLFWSQRTKVQDR